MSALYETLEVASIKLLFLIFSAMLPCKANASLINYSVYYFGKLYKTVKSVEVILHMSKETLTI